MTKQFISLNARVLYLLGIYHVLYEIQMSYNLFTSLYIDVFIDICKLLWTLFLYFNDWFLGYIEENALFYFVRNLL